MNCGPDEDQPAYDTTFGTIFCGFQALLANLRKAIDDISISGKSWQTGSLADSASFIDGKQIREVIEAAVLSNASGVCVKIGEID